MARYIDADALIKKIYPMGIGDGKYAINAGAVKFAIDNAPTADVVPKSEVEELTREKESLAKTVNEASELICKLRSKIDELKKDRYQVLPDGRIELLPRTDIEKIKTDVAREIFEEIELEIKEALDSTCEARRIRLKNIHEKREIPLCYCGDEIICICDGKITALREIEYFLAELKKKYIKGD